MQTISVLRRCPGFLPAFLFCGTWQGWAAAAIADASTFVLYQHPWSFVVFMGEAAFIAALSRKKEMTDVVVVTVYWAFIGAPRIKTAACFSRAP